MGGRLNWTISAADGYDPGGHYDISLFPTDDLGKYPLTFFLGLELRSD